MWLFKMRNLLVPTAKRLRPRRTVPRAGRALQVRLHLEVLEDRTVPSGGLVGNLVIFGDSLSDTGNAALATGGALPNPALYYQGRFSNGPIWVDTLAKYLGEPPVQPSLAGGLDYAFGGATVAYQNQPPPFNMFPRLSQQVGQYLAGHAPGAKDLITVWAGANDFIESFSSPTGPINPILSADTLATSLGTLANAGARQFVVPNLPPLGETPFIRGLGIPGLSAAADQWTAAFDGELAADVGNFKSSHPGATVVSLDVAGLFQQATQPSNPSGFVNTTDGVGPLVPGSPFLAAVTATDPQDYLFFDGIHPTSKAHQLIGVEAAAKVYDALGVHHLVVTSTADTVDPTAAGLSLREMVNLSNAMDGQQTITFDLGPGPQQINLSGKDLPITQDLAVFGPGAEKLTINSNAASRVLEVQSGVTATLTGLTIANGLADQGGGIDNAGTLTLSHDVLANNEAVGDSSTTGVGGGVFNEAGASLTVTQSTFLNNQVVGGSAGLGDGGGLMNEGTALVTGSMFTGNKATGGTANPGAGGGIESSAGSIRVSDSTFSNNLAIGASAGLFYSALGGAIDSSGGPATIADSTFNGNQAKGNAPGALAGGGAINANGTVMTVSNSTFTGNQALGGAGADGVTTLGAAGGGAIISGTNLRVTNSAFTNNQAIGATMAVGAPSSFFTTSDGGGIYASGGTLTLTNSSLVGNRVVGGAGSAGGAGMGALGGGIDVSFGATAAITNSSLADNSAVGGAGGSGAPGGAGAGGGIEVSFGSTASVSNTVLTANHALGGAGGSGADGGAGVGGAISVGTAVLFGFADASSLTVKGSTVTGNIAQGGAGGSGGNGGNGLGGGVYVASGTACIDHTSVTGNQAVGGAGGKHGSGGQGIGGGIYIASIAAASGMETDITGNFASTSNDDVFGVFNPSC